MTKKIITLLVTFFIFLTNVTLVSATSKELTEYPGQSQAVDIIIEAIKSNDVDKIEAMFNSESRKGIIDLHRKIENMISVIDSEILSYTSSGSYQKDKIERRCEYEIY